MRSWKAERCTDEARLAASSRRFKLGDGFTEARMLFCLLLDKFQVSTVRTSFKKTLMEPPVGGSLPLLRASWGKEFTHQQQHTGSGNPWRQGELASCHHSSSSPNSSTPKGQGSCDGDRAMVKTNWNQCMSQAKGRIEKKRRPELGHLAWPRG